MPSKVHSFLYYNILKQQNPKSKKEKQVHSFSSLSQNCTILTKKILHSTCRQMAKIRQSTCGMMNWEPCVAAAMQPKGLPTYLQEHPPLGSSQASSVACSILLQASSATKKQPHYLLKISSLKLCKKSSNIRGEGCTCSAYMASFSFKMQSELACSRLRVAMGFNSKLVFLTTKPSLHLRFSTISMSAI